MTLVLFALLAVLFALEFTGQRLLRIAAVVAIGGVAASTVVDLQMQVRICHSDQMDTAEYLKEMDPDTCQVAARASQKYLQALAQASAEHPFRHGFGSYLVRERSSAR